MNRCRDKPAIIFGEGKYIGPIEKLGILSFEKQSGFETLMASSRLKHEIMRCGRQIILLVTQV